MPSRIGHQPPENPFTFLGNERWTQDLPTKGGWYWYTEMQVRDKAEAVWLCKVYRYKQNLWVRFFTGPYRIRLKGNSTKGRLIYVRTAVAAMYLRNGNLKWWLKAGAAPQAPFEIPVYKTQVGKLPQKPGAQTRPRPIVVIVKKKER